MCVCGCVCGVGECVGVFCNVWACVCRVCVWVCSVGVCVIWDVCASACGRMCVCVCVCVGVCGFCNVWVFW